MVEVHKWVGISGSWRRANPQLEQDVRSTVSTIIQKGDGIISGGALNVDYFATDEAIKNNGYAQVKIFIPATLDIYAKRYLDAVEEGIITKNQAEDLIAQLTRFKEKNPLGLIENQNNKEVDQKSYFERNEAVVDAADELIAFQVNNSPGVQDTIDKARLKGIPVDGAYLHY